MGAGSGPPLPALVIVELNNVRGQACRAHCRASSIALPETRTGPTRRLNRLGDTAPVERLQQPGHLRPPFAADGHVEAGEQPVVPLLACAERPVQRQSRNTERYLAVMFLKGRWL